MTPFTIEHNTVVWITNYGPIKLNDAMCEQLLGIWSESDDIAAARLYCELHEAYLKNGGIARVTSRRAA